MYLKRINDNKRIYGQALWGSDAPQMFHFVTNTPVCWHICLFNSNHADLNFMV